MEIETTYVNVPISGKNSNGLYTKVDADDLHLFAGRSVFAHGRQNDVRPYVRMGGKNVLLYHLFMCEKPSPLHTVDHINNDVLDNRKVNLRWATKTEQCMNRRKISTSCSSVYKGVSYCKKAGKVNEWRAQIRINKKLKHIGYFSDEKEAAKAYNRAAIEHFGEFANLNEFSDDEDTDA